MQTLINREFVMIYLAIEIAAEYLIRSVDVIARLPVERSLILYLKIQSELDREQMELARFNAINEIKKGKKKSDHPRRSRMHK